MTQPNPFDPWEFRRRGEDKIRHMDPKLRRLCKHGKIAVFCPTEQCFREAFHIAYPPPVPDPNGGFTVSPTQPRAPLPRQPNQPLGGRYVPKD